jgi:poly(3-hydroxybutyrate) depolymerase
LLKRPTQVPHHLSRSAAGVERQRHGDRKLISHLPILADADPHRSRPSPPTDLKLAEFRHRDRDRVESIGLRNGCDPGPVSTAVADGVERFAWPCPPGAEVELVVTDGDGHTWPGSSAQQEWVSFLGPVTMEIDATEMIWDFFEQQPMPD